MDRRALLLGLLSAGTLGISREAGAYNRCKPHWQFGQVCEAGVELDEIVYAQQDESQWCWAASVEMVFRYYGYDIDQKDIVQAVYGQLVNLPALSGSVISKQLSRVWQDHDGRRFRAQIQGLYDFDAGVLGLTNAQIVSALRNERPLILGTVNHAMLLTAVAYIPTNFQPNIINIGLVDPFPGIGVRGPQHPGEMVPMHSGGALRYLALPRISPL